MGLFSWMFPSPEKRLAKAQAYLDQGEFVAARDEVAGIESSEADNMRQRAQHGLVSLNLEAAASWADAGDEERVAMHLELADQFHDGTQNEQFKDTRRQIRETRRARRELIEKQERAAAAKLMDIDPLGFGGGSMVPMGLEGEVGGEAEQNRARLALVVENYPEGLRAAIAELGPQFGQAILDLEDGRAEIALQALLDMPEDQPMVAWERARCAYAMGDPGATSRELQRFAKLAGGHHSIGREHSGLFLARATAEMGDPHGALRIVRDLRAASPKLGHFLFAQLLAATKQLDEAETVLRKLIKDHPKEASLYKMLAQVRIDGGHRIEAMAALEMALQKESGCLPGNCSYRPPDPQVRSMLATLYLEDGRDTKRALQLLDEVERKGQPSWDEQYLVALASNARGDHDAGRMIQDLHSHTPTGDARAQRLQKYLPAPA